MDRIERFGLAGVMLFLFVFYQFLSPYIVLIITSLGRALLGPAASF
jgi:hypothetical protein